MLQSLKGKHSAYIFDDEKKEDLLRDKGKFGNTYIGKDEKGEKVVIKKLSTHLKKDEKAVKRFLREAEIPSAHTNIIKCRETFEQNGDYYLVREFVEGKSLKEIKADAKFIIQCAIKVLDALEYLHKQNIVHRDVRPNNIIVNGDNVTLIDLGLAKTANDENEKTPFSLIYSSPEQVLNSNEFVNASSDLYSLAITIYECITGKSAFSHTHPEMLMHMMINKPIEPNRKIPAQLFSVLLKATNKCSLPKPPRKYTRKELINFLLEGQKHRYSSASEFREALLAVDLKEANRNLFDFFKKISQTSLFICP